MFVQMSVLDSQTTDDVSAKACNVCQVSATIVMWPLLGLAIAALAQRPVETS